MVINAQDITALKNATPDVIIDATGQSAVVLPEDFSLTGSQFARQGDDLLIRALDGVVIAVRGFYAATIKPKLIEHNAAEAGNVDVDPLASEYVDLEEELAQEELANEDGATIADFETDAGGNEEIQEEEFAQTTVVEGDYTGPFENETMVTVQQTDTVKIPDEIFAVASNDTGFNQPVYDEVETMVTEAEATPTPAPVPQPEPEPEPEPIPEDNDNPESNKGPGKPEKDGDKGGGRDKGKGKDRDHDDDSDDDNSDDDIDDLTEPVPVDETTDETYVFQSGDGKVKIPDFDLGDVIRFEGFDSDDILIKSKGKNIEVSIVGDKSDKVTISGTSESDADSYSITQTDDGCVIVTLDSE